MGRKVCALSISFIACLIFVCSTHAGDSSNLHRDKTHAFSIVFPTGWQQRNGQTPSTVVVSESPYEDSIVIQVRQIPAQATLENLPAAELKAMFTDMAEALRVRFPDIVVKDSGTTYINNTKAIWMLYTYSYKQPFRTTKVTTMFYQVWHEGRIFSILCTSPSERYKLMSKTFLTSVRTFIFESPSWYGK
jgi:hypothetical protein